MYVMINGPFTPLDTTFQSDQKVEFEKIITKIGTRKRREKKHEKSYTQFSRKKNTEQLCHTSMRHQHVPKLLDFASQLQ